MDHPLLVLLACAVLVSALAWDNRHKHDIWRDDE